MPARLLLLLALLVSAGRPWCAAAGDVRIDADYPGGNVRLVKREGNTFTLAPDLRDTQSGGWWFYYNFRLRAPAGQSATIVFAQKNPIGVRGPARSVDGGRTWQWLGPDAVTKSGTADNSTWSFAAAVPAGATEARFAFAPPYQESHLREFLSAHANHPALRVAELCRSRQGRSVELLRIGGGDSASTRGVVLLTSRHHACESIATYTLEGLLRAALADDDLGRRWRAHWEIVALPFADKDGVENGDQGKNRAPHDHNRDYNAEPLYPEIRAWMKLGESLRSRVAFSLDLHCPHIRGKWNDRVYLVGSAGSEAAQKERAFAQVLERVRAGPIPFRATESYLAAGSDWNTSANYAAGRSNSSWAREKFPTARLASTLEIAYADALGTEVNADSARALGHDLARAILEILEARPGTTR